MSSSAAGEALSGREPPAVDGVSGAGRGDAAARQLVRSVSRGARAARSRCDRMGRLAARPRPCRAARRNGAARARGRAAGAPGGGEPDGLSLRAGGGFEQARSGTRAPELAGALEKLSGGRLSCVPISGSWSADAVVRLVDEAGALGARLIANIRTGRLWASRPALDVLLGWLERGEAPDPPPPPDWDVGHFVELAQLVRGRSGTLVVRPRLLPDARLVGSSPPASRRLWPRLWFAAMGGAAGCCAWWGPSRRGAARRLVRALGLDTELWHN